MREVVFAVPGELATLTGGYVYDRRIIEGLAALGWRTAVVNLGHGFPFPATDTRTTAGARLAALPIGPPIVVDGLAFGALPDAAEALRATHSLVALVHHPLALESGLSATASAALRASECTALGCARHVITTSPATARLLAADYDVPSDRLSVVEPGTERGANRLHRSESAIALLSVGAVVPRKGYDVLVAALAKLKHLPWRLVIAGDGERSPQTFRRLVADIASLGLTERITLAGTVSAERLASLYASADLFVLPSRFEGYGMAYAEAIAHGVPVVGTNAGAIPDTIPSAAGVLVPPDDVEALAAALQRLIADPAERERLAAGARASAFPSWSGQAALFARVLASIQ